MPRKKKEPDLDESLEEVDGTVEEPEEEQEEVEDEMATDAIGAAEDQGPEEDEEEMEEKEKSDKDLQVLSGEPGILKFEGREYALKSLGLTTMSQLHTWAKKRIMHDLHEDIALMGEAAPKELVTKRWEEAMASLRDPLVSPSMECPESVSFWVYLSLHANDKSITEEKAASIVEGNSLKAVMEMLMRLNSISRDDVENPQVREEVRRRRNP